MPGFDHLLCAKTINKGEEVGILFMISMSILGGKRGEEVQVRMMLSLFCRVCINKAQSSEESQSENCITYVFFRKSETCSTVRDTSPYFLPRQIY